MFAPAVRASAPSPAPSAGTEAAPRDPLPRDPSPREADILHTLLGRLQAEQGLSAMPTPVDDTIHSLTDDVVKSFDGGPDSRFSRATIRIRTRLAHWDPTLMTDGAGGRASSRTVGWYAWQWEVTTVVRQSDRSLTITADNILMLDPSYTIPNEGSPIGRYMNDALLYHELLHGQLLINAMDDPAWREALLSSGNFDSSESDASHKVISGLERDFLLHRSGDLAFTVPSVTDANGNFSLVAGRLDSGFRGEVSMEFRTTAGGNIQSLRLDLPDDGPYRGDVVIHGRLADPGQTGFFLANITPHVNRQPALTASKDVPTRAG